MVPPNRCGDTILITFREHGVSDEPRAPQERRRTPRYPFIATAEVVDAATKTSIATRVIELSLYGCYIEMRSPLPQGTAIHVKVYSEGRFFEAAGTVVYAIPNGGIGVRFHDVRHQYLIVLKEWLIAAAQAKFGKQPKVP
jgi:PilZ domain